MIEQGDPVVTAAVKEARRSLVALVLELPREVWVAHKGAVENAIAGLVEERLDLLAQRDRLRAALVAIDERCDAYPYPPTSPGHATLVAIRSIVRAEIEVPARHVPGASVGLRGAGLDAHGHGRTDARGDGRARPVGSDTDARGGGDLTVIDVRDLLRELASTTCRCGAIKKARQTFCSRCYYRLSPPLRLALYQLIGEGYEEAYSAAAASLDARGEVS